VELSLANVQKCDAIADVRSLAAGPEEHEPTLHAPTVMPSSNEARLTATHPKYIVKRNEAANGSN
jgi:hypothetical protein